MLREIILNYQMIIILYFILSVLELKLKKNKYILNIIGILGISILFFKFFRINSIVPDYGLYMELYYNLNLDPSLEKGYVLIEKIGHFFKLPFNHYRIIVGLITIILLFKGFKKINTFPIISTFISLGNFFIEKPYIQIRNALSIVIFLNILTLAVEKKRKILTFLGIILSTFFHVSSYLYFIIYCFYRIKINKKNLVKYFCFILLISLVFSSINFIQILENNLGIFSGRVLEKIKFYFISKEGQKYREGFRIGIRTGVTLLVFILYFVQNYFYLKNKNRINRECKLNIYIFYFLGIFLFFRVMSSNIGVFQRVAGCFEFAEILAIVSLITNKKLKSNLQIFILIIIYFYIAIIAYRTFLNIFY